MLTTLKKLGPGLLFAGAIILGIAFVCLGYFVVFNIGKTFSNKVTIFSNQLIDL